MESIPLSKKYNNNMQKLIDRLNQDLKNKDSRFFRSVMIGHIDIEGKRHEGIMPLVNRVLFKRFVNDKERRKFNQLIVDIENKKTNIKKEDETWIKKLIKSLGLFPSKSPG